MRYLTLSLLLLGMTGAALAGTASVPEIDANTGLAAVTMVSGGLLILRSRRNRK